MIRYAFNTTRARMCSLYLPAARPSSTSTNLGSKARVSQILGQAHSAVPAVYKTVKEKPFGGKTVRRNQLIWLIKHSFGKDATATKVSPHDLPWGTGPVVKSGKKEGGQLDVTVWPHLW